MLFVIICGLIGLVFGGVGGFFVGGFLGLLILGMVME